MHEIKDIPADWTESEREDIRLARAARFAGFTVMAKKECPAGTVPADSLTFKQGERVIWEGSNGWRCADIIDGRHQNHRTHRHLVQAIRAEYQVFFKGSQKRSDN